MTLFFLIISRSSAPKKKHLTNKGKQTEIIKRKTQPPKQQKPANSGVHHTQPWSFLWPLSPVMQPTFPWRIPGKGDHLVVKLSKYLTANQAPSHLDKTLYYFTRIHTLTANTHLPLLLLSGYVLNLLAPHFKPSLQFIKLTVTPRPTFRMTTFLPFFSSPLLVSSVTEIPTQNQTFIPASNCNKQALPCYQDHTSNPSIHWHAIITCKVHKWSPNYPWTFHPGYWLRLLP